MLFEIQNALGGKVIASRSALTTLRNAMTLLPNAKFEVIPPVTKKAEFGSMPNFRDPVPETDSDEDDDDIMHDPDIQEMVENGEHTCHMFDAHCQACEDDEEEEESEDEDGITIAELMWDIHNDITLADLTKQIIREENRLKKKKEKEQAVSSDEEGPFGFVDEMTYHSRSSDHLPNF